MRRWLLLVILAGCSAPPSPLLDYHLALARKYRQSGERFLAIEELKKALSIDPSSSDVRFELARVLLEEGRTEEALLHLKSLYDSHAQGTGVEYIRALSLLGRWEDALESARTLLRSRPHDTETIRALVEVLIELGRERDAMGVLNSLPPQIAQDRSILKLRAYALLASGRLDEARKLYYDLSDTPGLAECFAREGDFSRALKLLLSSGKHPIEVIRLKIRAGKFAEAKRMVEGYLTSEPASAPAHRISGCLSVDMGRLEEAKHHLTAIGASPEALLLKAKLLAEKGQKRALSLVDRYILLKRRSADGWTVRGDVALKLREYLISAESYARALRIEESLPARLRLIEALSSLGEKHRVLRQLELTLSRFPYSSEVRLLSAKLFFEAGQEARAFIQMQEYLKLQPESAEGHALLAAMYERQGILPSATTEYKRALRSDPMIEEAYLGLARCLKKQGFLREARRWLERGVKLRPDSYRLKSALSSLDTSSR